VGCRALIRRKKGSAPEDLDRLGRLYNDACRQRRPTPPTAADALAAATAGDPLVVEDRACALNVYGITSVPRPTARIRKIGAEVWGDILAQLAIEAEAFQARELQASRPCSNAKAAAEILAAAAQNGFSLASAPLLPLMTA
jgi:hypothetical protein